MKGNEELRALMDRLRPYIKSYLSLKGINPGKNGKYRCINPHHEDKTPSAGMVPPNDLVLHCHGCGMSADLFKAVSILEGRPSSGHEFVEENVYYVADLFSVPYERIELGAEDIYRLQLRDVYSQARDLVSAHKSSLVTDMYGWGPEVVSKWGVGTVSGWKDFSEALAKAANVSKAFLDRAGITSQIFNEHMIIFSISDAYGRTVGFGARDTRWKEGSSRAKWVNTENGALYHKGNVLYGLDMARMYNQVYLFEGYGDVIEARLQGMLNCSALCGTNLTVGQVSLLKNLGKKEIILCLDTDAEGAGQDATQRIIDTHFSGQEALKVGVVNVPAAEGESIDPRDFIRERGVIEFKNLEVKDVYKWRLDKFPDDATPEDICEVMLPLIINEPRAYRRERHLRTLSERTGVRLKALQKDFDKMAMEQETNKKGRIAQEAEALASRLRDSHPRQTDALVREAIRSIREIEGEAASIDTLSEVETLDFVDGLKKSFFNRPEGLLGWHTGMSFWDKNIEGMPKAECIVSIAAVENVGKTAAMSQLSWQIANHGKNKDVVVLVMTIDDSRAQFLPRYISMDTGLPLNAVVHPKHYALTDEDAHKLKKSWKRLRMLIHNGRLNVKDTTHGSTIGVAEKWIVSTLEDNPNAKILFFLDNFHKLTARNGLEDKARVDFHSEEMDRMSKMYQMTWVCTQELRKHEGRPTLQDLLGSAQLAYDNNICVIMDQEMHRKQSTSQVWYAENDEAQTDPLPMNSWWFAKNKVTGWKGTQWMNFWPDRSMFFESEAPASDVLFGDE